jgi:hypothetical protein
LIEGEDDDDEGKALVVSYPSRPKSWELAGAQRVPALMAEVVRAEIRK